MYQTKSAFQSWHMREQLLKSDCGLRGLMQAVRFQLFVKEA